MKGGNGGRKWRAEMEGGNGGRKWRAEMEGGMRGRKGSVERREWKGGEIGLGNRKKRRKSYFVVLIPRNSQLIWHPFLNSNQLNFFLVVSSVYFFLVVVFLIISKYYYGYTWFNSKLKRILGSVILSEKSAVCAYVCLGGKGGRKDGMCIV
jgi:hypothetical protein